VENQLERVDRTTLRAWRGANVLGWSALAVVAAVIVNQTLIQLWGRVVFSLGGLNIRPDLPIGQAGFPYTRFVAKAATFVLVGVVIGAIVGARVWKHQVTIAGVASLGYVLISVFVLEYSFRHALVDALSNTEAAVFGHDTIQRGWGTTGWTGVSYDLLGLFAILAAMLVARRMARRRP
jgi:hypothetical protein